MKNSCFPILLCYFLISFSSFSQVAEKKLLFKSINTESGLSNNVVFDILQDAKGYMWFATNNGLNRYDGYSVETFFHSEKDSSSISSNSVLAIIEDLDHILWVGTGQGLNRFDRETGGFEAPLVNSSYSDSSRAVQSMHLDGDGIIWVQIDSEVALLNPKTCELNSIYNNDANHLSITPDNQTIWITNSLGEITSYQKATGKLTSEVPVLKMGSLHYGEYSKSLWAPKSFRSKTSSSNLRHLPQIPNDQHIKSLLELDATRAWLGSDSGLYEYNFDTKSLFKINLGKSTLNNQIRCLYKDLNGGVWVGTLGGVFHYDPYRKSFAHRDIIEDHDDVVMGLHVNQNGAYVNALGKGLYFKDNNSNNFKPIVLPKTYPKEGLFIWDIETVEKSSFPLWLATNEGVLCINPKTSSFQKIDIPFSKKDEHISFSILNSVGDFLWVATHGAIHQIRKKDRQLLASFELGEELTYPGIQKIIGFGDHIFIATENNGLFKLHIPSREIAKVYLNKNKDDFNVPIWDLYATEEQLWIGANDGLYKLSAEDLPIEPILEDNQVIFSIISDDTGVLWMGSDKGIKSYDPKSKKTNYYTTIDGIKNTEFNRKSVVKDASGYLWFGGVNGVTSFNPELIKINNPNSPYVYITDLRVATSDSTFSVSKFSDKVTLPWQHNTVEIDYIGLNYTNSLQNTYRYIMDGHDPNWVIADKPTTARYVKLPVGEYSFNIQAANNDGLWNTQGASLRIKVFPPFWRTKTAYILYFLTILGLFQLFRRLKKYREKIHLVEEEKEIIAKKVEEKFIALNNKTKVYLKDLKYIKAAGNYLEFHTSEKVILDRNKLKLLEGQLPPNFIRTHRSYIVNKNYITSVNSASVFIKPNTETPLSRSFKGSLK